MKGIVSGGGGGLQDGGGSQPEGDCRMKAVVSPRKDEGDSQRWGGGAAGWRG